METNSQPAVMPKPRRILLPVAVLASLAVLALVGSGLIARRYVHARQTGIVLYMLPCVQQVVEPADYLRETWQYPPAETPRDQALAQIQAHADEWTKLLFTLHTMETPPECRTFAEAIEEYLLTERQITQDMYLYLATGDPARKAASLDAIAQTVSLRDRVTDEAYALAKWPFPRWWPW